MRHERWSPALIGPVDRLRPDESETIDFREARPDGRLDVEVGFTTSDETIFTRRVLRAPSRTPAFSSDVARARLRWCTRGDSVYLNAGRRQSSWRTDALGCGTRCDLAGCLFRSRSARGRRRWR